MKTHYVKKNAVVALVCVCLGIICYAATSHAAAKKSDAPAQNSSDMAKLVVVRTDSVGSGITAAIAVDGKDLVTLSRGRSFHGSVSPGKHVISVMPDPNLIGQSPNKTEFTAEKGHTYSFSVSSKSGKVVLVKNP
jgi:hypothetical protein